MQEGEGQGQVAQFCSLSTHRVNMWNIHDKWALEPLMDAQLGSGPLPFVTLPQQIYFFKMEL